MLLLRLQHSGGSRGRYDAPRYALGVDSDANADTHRGHPGLYAEVTSTVVSLTLVALVISISDSLASDQGKQVVCDGETGPSERPEVPVMERILLHSGEGSSAIIPVRSNPYTWGGPQHTWQDCAAPGDKHVFTPRRPGGDAAMAALPGHRPGSGEISLDSTRLHPGYVLMMFVFLS